jgi:hypothetical protein
MIDSVPTNVLQNCTASVINRFPELTSVNNTYIGAYNRTIVVEVLSDIFTKHSDIYTDASSQIQFKYVECQE